MLKSISAALTGLAIATTAVASPALAQQYDGYRGAPHGYQNDGYRGGDYRQGDYRQGDYRQRDYRQSGYDYREYNRGPSYHRNYRNQCNDGDGGTIIGAIAGGLLGRGISGRGDHVLGTVIGAGAGALAGRAIDRSDRPGYCR